MNGHVSVVDALLRSGVDINRKNAQGNTALMFASGGGYTRVVRLLLERDADPGLRNLDRKQAKDFAMVENHKDVIGLLETRSSRFPW